MTFFRSVLLFCPMACLFAQTPPPTQPPKSPAAPPMTVTMSAENPKPSRVVPPDRVIIAVGDTKITAAQFDQIIDTIPEQARAAARGPGRKQLADQLVRILILAEEGKRRKLDEGSSYKLSLMIQ